MESVEESPALSLASWGNFYTLSSPLNPRTLSRGHSYTSHTGGREDREVTDSLGTRYVWSPFLATWGYSTLNPSAPGILSAWKFTGYRDNHSLLLRVWRRGPGYGMAHGIASKALSASLSSPETHSGQRSTTTPQVSGVQPPWCRDPLTQFLKLW